jgi:hypothetical protein
LLQRVTKNARKKECQKKKEKKKKKKYEAVVVHSIRKGSLQEAPSGGGVGKLNAASALGGRAWTKIAAC